MIDVSVAMIGRDESAVLQRALRSVAEIAREIIFVDTGSRDDTVSIAQEFGARIFHFEWRDDFASARNAALEQARGAWILSLDCDEELAPGEAPVEALMAGCSSAEARAFLVDIENMRLDGPPVVHSALRLFRNDPRIRFENPVHESVAESLYANWPQEPVASAGLLLRHHGYARADNADKALRNEKILRAWLEREPLNIYASFKYGAALAHRRDRGAVEWLGRAFELLDRARDRASYPFRHALAQAFISELRRGRLHEEAEKARIRASKW